MRINKSNASLLHAIILVVVLVVLMQSCTVTRYSNGRKFPNYAKATTNPYGQLMAKSVQCPNCECTFTFNSDYNGGSVITFTGQCQHSARVLEGNWTGYSITDVSSSSSLNTYTLN
jgi:hypothetical protein